MCYAVSTEVELAATKPKGEIMKMKKTKYCLIEKNKHILKVSINRPERLNALHPMANLELAEVFNDFAADDEMWVAIITGEGRAFSAGNDLRYQAEGGERLPMPLGFAGLTARFDLVKPVIAAVNGVAMGGGFEIALACDLIVASENAVFALPEPKVGLAALAGGLNRLPRQIGTKRALGMILTGRHVSSIEGEKLGFVNEVVPSDELMSRAYELANEIIACSPLSIRASKDAVYRSLDFASLEESMKDMRTNYAAIKAMINSEDFIEGPKAFAEKRPPNWKGK